MQYSTGQQQNSNTASLGANKMRYLDILCSNPAGTNTHTRARSHKYTNTQIHTRSRMHNCLFSIQLRQQHTASSEHACCGFLVRAVPLLRCVLRSAHERTNARACLFVCEQTEWWWSCVWCGYIKFAMPLLCASDASVCVACALRFACACALRAWLFGVWGGAHAGLLRKI